MSQQPGTDPATSTTGATEAAPSTETDLLFALVRERHGSRLMPEQLEAVRQGVAAIVEETRALRAVSLRNADGPLLPPAADA